MTTIRNSAVCFELNSTAGISSHFHSGSISSKISLTSFWPLPSRLNAPRPDASNKRNLISSVARIGSSKAKKNCRCCEAIDFVVRGGDGVRAKNFVCWAKEVNTQKKNNSKLVSMDFLLAFFYYMFWLLFSPSFASWLNSILFLDAFFLFLFTSRKAKKNAQISQLLGMYNRAALSRPELSTFHTIVGLQIGEIWRVHTEKWASLCLIELALTSRFFRYLRWFQSSSRAVNSIWLGGDIE